MNFFPLTGIDGDGGEKFKQKKAIAFGDGLVGAKLSYGA